MKQPTIIKTFYPKLICQIVILILLYNVAQKASSRKCINHLISYDSKEAVTKTNKYKISTQLEELLNDIHMDESHEIKVLGKQYFYKVCLNSR